MKETGFRVIKPQDNPHTLRKIKGKPYLTILEKVQRIALYQKENIIQAGIKGFVFHGDVGIGKTVCAKTVANNLSCPLIFVDGADVARKFYGESESQISNIFNEAQKYNYSIILIDDAESVFPTRDWQKGEAWHFAQNNVFFHQLDNIDTSKTLVIITTNRFDLIDKAVKDRLYNIEFPLPTKEVLKEIAEYKCNQLNMDTKTINQLIENNGVKTVRELEKFITEIYIEEILRRT